MHTMAFSRSNRYDVRIAWFITDTIVTNELQLAQMNDMLGLAEFVLVVVIFGAAVLRTD